MTTIAFHGQFATPGMLRYDAGDPEWIDKYLYLVGRNPFHRELIIEETLDYLLSLERMVFAGFSEGGRDACRLSNSFLRDKIRKPVVVGLILYEAPIPREGLLGDMPVIYVRSKKPVKRYDLFRRARESRMNRIIRDLKRNHEVTVLESKHGHTKTVTLPDGSRRKGHGWDVGLNERLGDWVKEVSTEA